MRIKTIRLKCLSLEDPICQSTQADRPSQSLFLRVMEKKAALTLEEEIAELKDEIARCWSRHDGTQDDELKKTYAATINTRAASLLLLQQREERQLLAQQQQQQINPGSHLNHILHIFFSFWLSYSDPATVQTPIFGSLDAFIPMLDEVIRQQKSMMDTQKSLMEQQKGS
jgi:predicted DNA-binding protein (MmcQ/YjbR family)